MMKPSGTKFSGEKTVPHSDLLAGTASDKIIKKELNRIITWNVRSLGVCDKLENIDIEMKRANIDIMGMCGKTKETFGATITELFTQETKTAIQELE